MMRSGYQGTSWAWHWMRVVPAVFLRWRRDGNVLWAVWIPPSKEGRA